MAVEVMEDVCMEVCNKYNVPFELFIPTLTGLEPNSYDEEVVRVEGYILFPGKHFCISEREFERMNVEYVATLQSQKIKVKN